MKRQGILFAVFLGAFLSGCNSNPGWDGHESSTKADKIAEEGCKCIYETMDAETAFDMGEIMDGLEDFIAHQASGGEGSISEKWPDIATAMLMVGELSDKIDGSPCMSEVDDKAMQQGVAIGDMFNALDKHCKLAIFYN